MLMERAEGTKMGGVKRKKLWTRAREVSNAEKRASQGEIQPGGGKHTTAGVGEVIRRRLFEGREVRGKQ